ncbi:MAG: CIA30 family protein [Synechococcales cyanobacterium RM1_1_8]|nr:CIA30 family protein [Synechococcales cyanobacterium RM1_1_8]
MTQPRAPWDFGRLWQTLRFFDAIPLLSWIQRMLFGSMPPPPPQPQAGVIFDFGEVSQGLDQASLDQTWGAVDDVVMGGVSRSGFQALENGNARFTGIVSTDNNGGFASVRTRNFEPSLDLAQYRGIALRLKGDGQRYKFLIRDDSGWDSLAFAYSFNTERGKWITVQVPFDQLVPVQRAKTVPGARPLRTSGIRALQLMLSKFEYDGALNPRFEPGEFCLEIAKIEAF